MTQLRESGVVGYRPQQRVEQRNGSEFDEARAWVDVFSAGVRLLMKNRPELFQSLNVGSTTVALAETVVNGQHQNGNTVEDDTKVHDAQTIISYLANKVGLRAEPMNEPTKQ